MNQSEVVFYSPSTRFTRYENRFILPPEGKSLERQGRDLVDMGINKLSGVTLVILPHQSVGVAGTDLFCVNVSKPLERVDSNNDVTRSRVWMVLHVTLFEIIKNGSLQSVW